MSAPVLSVAEIQIQLNALVKAMMAKGLSEPFASFDIRSDATPQLYMKWRGKPESRHDSGFEFFHGEAATSLAEAFAFVASLPPPEVARVNAFMAALGEAIELGKKADVEVEFVNPLVALMKKLSNNALTHDGRVSS